MRLHTCYARATNDDTGVCVVRCPSPRAAADVFLSECCPVDDEVVEVHAWVEGRPTGGVYAVERDAEGLAWAGRRLRTVATPGEQIAVYGVAVYWPTALGAP